ncbi:MAG TPA: hypothetical protein VHT03_06300 [Rhizomicrobium sp.]|jgi:hypothetical protein|nr:hypothetical protein [Rhizomicrobium sp.]
MKSSTIGAALLGSALTLSTTPAVTAPTVGLQAARIPHRAFTKPSLREIRNALQQAGRGARRDDAQYTVIDDPDEGYALGQGTFAFGMNSSAAVVGYYDDGKTHGYERAPDGSYRTIDVGRSGSAASDIDDTGDIVGQTNFYADNGKTKCPAFLLTSKDRLRRFEPPGAGCSTDTFSIGSDASIVGDYIGSDDMYHGFVRSKDGTILVIDAPNAVETFASDINDSGAVVGTSIDDNGYHGYIRAADGTFTTFDAPGGPASGDIASRINNLGQTEGDYANADGVEHGLIRNADGSLVVYDAAGAGQNAGQGTYGFSGINEAGTAAGYYVDANNVSHGYVRSSDGTLTEFDPPGSLWTVVWDINADGVVTGTYMDRFANFHGFLRTP